MQRMLVDGPRLPLTGLRLGPPVTTPRNIVGVGMNYPGTPDAARESRPAPPVLFLKPPSSLIGTNDAVVLPGGKVLCEVELAIVIGALARHVPAERAREVIAGYTLANDCTLPDLLAPIAAGDRPPPAQVLRAKGPDTLLPLGPAIVTADEVDDVDALELRLTVNGEVRQSGRVGDMLVGVDALVESVTSFMTLGPGDLILTGTPLLGTVTEPSLRAGDIIDASASRIGTLTHPVVDPGVEA
jgi:2-keto-4-pentenoate hydratase/2-oxohepta-3-ene-1,7-dioic acid hydratase in catechol pathway